MRSSARTTRPRPIALHKKLAFSLAVFITFFAVIEGALRLLDIGRPETPQDPFLGFAGAAPLFVEQVSEGECRRVTAPAKLTWFNEQSFPCRKSPGTKRIFCLGGSTTYGRPYDDRTSFSGWLRAFLAEADAEQDWEVINAGGISYASYRVARVLDELLEYEPDLFVIYTGHNEFLERRTYGTFIQTPEMLRDAGSLLSRSRLFSALHQVVDRPGQNRADSQPFQLQSEVEAILDRTIGLQAYHRDDTFRGQVLEHFEWNLRRMIERVQSAGVRVILVTPASNLKDFAPFKSESQFEAGTANQVRLDKLLAQASELRRQGDLIGALTRLEEARDLDPRYAQTWYGLGRVLLEQGRIPEAQAAFLQAREEDVCPLRALGAIQQSIVRIAGQHDVPVIDFPGLLVDSTGVGIPGAESFLDHVHPTIEGHRRLALEILDQIRVSGELTLAPDWGTERIERIRQQIEQQIDEGQQGLALANLAKVLGWAGRTEEAGRIAVQALGKAPENGHVQYLAGNAYLDQGDLATALKCFESAVGLQPGTAEHHYGLGLVQSLMGDDARAVAAYRNALVREPDFTEAHYNLGQILADRSELGAARDHFLHVLRRVPEHFEAANALGVVFAQQQDYERAEHYFREALRSEPEFDPARNNLERLLSMKTKTP